MTTGVTNSGVPTAAQSAQLMETWTSEVKEKLVGLGAMEAGGQIPDGLLSKLNALSQTAHGSVVFDNWFNGLTGDNAATETRLVASLNDAEKGAIKAAIAELLASVRDPDALAKMLIEFAANARQNALDARLSARAQAKSELHEQAGKTREAADKAVSAAWMQLGFAIGSAVVTGISAGFSAANLKDAGKLTGQLSKANKIMDKAGDIADAAGDTSVGRQAANVSSKAGRLGGEISKDIDLVLQKTNLINTVGGGAAQLATAGGTFGAGLENAAAQKIEADGQALAAEAQDTQADADLAKQFMDELQEMINSALQFLREISQAETEMMATASRL